ncbi:unnamed protein product [Orchesella dallaii]|uniref:DNA repair protein REV1 n=1 Tax=Orchesella dallaii TaxID=48710 RepID=A0ABP1QS04_9HEXA
MSLAKMLPRPPSSILEASNSVKNGVPNADSSKNNVTTNGTMSPANKVVSGRRRFGDNGFEEQGGYMAVKKAKLDNQFNCSKRVYGAGESDDSDVFNIFDGVSIYINGYTNPPEPELRELFIRHGGTFHPYNSSRTTFVVATNLSVPSKRLYGSKTIKPDWIVDSIKSGKALDTRAYMLYDLNKEKNQLTLTQVMGHKSSPSKPENTSIPKNLQLSNGGSSTNGIGGDESIEDFEVERTVETANISQDRVSDSDEEFFECSQDAVMSPRKIVSSTISIEHAETKTENQEGAAVTSDSSSASIFNEPLQVEDQNSKSDSPQKDGRMKTATDEGFIEDFFGRSRLHVISEQKKEMQILVGNLRKNSDSQSCSNLSKFASEIEDKEDSSVQTWTENVVLMHIDLDCFFASVGLLSRPHLRGKPVVVTHSSGAGKDSRSDIACASYEARKFGVRNGMWVMEAKKLCTTLQVIPYDFEEYKRISKLFFEAVASVTLDIEACSVDEMIVDATPVLKKVPGSTPENLATFIRKIVLETTNCPASIGIGSNRLLAKLAVKLAKPNGIHHLKDCDATSYIQSMQVRDLPGVGWSNEDKLVDNFGVKTCGDLLKIPLKDLKPMFGEKTAEKMLSLCKGIDSSDIKAELERPKSISVDVNFGIRFTKDDDVTNFLINICKELSGRAEKMQAVSSHFSLKLLTRKKGAGEPLKQGGHGIVDSHTRSRSLLTPTRNWQELYKTACSLIRLMRVPPTEYRGIGVTLTDLKFDDDKSKRKSIQRTLTDMPISRGQKMLTISQKKNKSASSTEKHANIPSPDGSQNSVEVIENGTSTRHHHLHPDNQEVPEDYSVTKSKIVQTQSNSTDSSTNTNAPVDVDINMLLQLPREIAEEQCQIFGISKDVLDIKENSALDSNMKSEGPTGGNDGKISSYYDNVETVDNSFLQALPDNVRQDVLIQLQEAKGRKATNGNLQYDEQQPCSSRQALERDKQREKLQNGDYEQPSYNLEIRELATPVSKSHDPLDQQVTPKISYFQSPTLQLEPQKFWDMSIYGNVLPSEDITIPALNNLTEVDDVRNLIRDGLQTVADPTTEDVECLEKYFIDLITKGWIQQASALLKFLNRQYEQLDESSPWVPLLAEILEAAQKTWRELYQGEIELDDEYQ